MTDIKPGSFGLSKISGKTGKLVEWGQEIVDRRPDKFTHAFFVLDNHQIIEAEPGGAKIVSLDKYLSRPSDAVMFADTPVELYMHEWTMDHGGYIGYPHGVGVPVATELAKQVEDELRGTLVYKARQMEGIPYNYFDYLAIGLRHWHLNLPGVTARLERQDRLICSQLVDFAYSKAGIQLFDDRRAPFDVTPGDLEHYVLTNNFGTL